MIVVIFKKYAKLGAQVVINWNYLSLVVPQVLDGNNKSGCKLSQRFMVTVNLF